MTDITIMSVSDLLGADPAVDAATEGRVFGDTDKAYIPGSNWWVATSSPANFTFTQHPSLAVNISVTLVRVERGRCAMCGLRRVRFRLQANTSTASEVVCARCAGLR